MGGLLPIEDGPLGPLEELGHRVVVFRFKYDFDDLLDAHILNTLSAHTRHRRMEAVPKPAALRN